MTHTITDYLPLLACPGCRGALAFQSGPDRHGWLECANCASSTPVLHGMVLFTETRFGEERSCNLAVLAEVLTGSPDSYEQYRQDKFRRNLVDAYAAFEPFNESTRCAEPFLRAAAQSAAPGAAVLDLGTRSAWSSSMLAAMFPLGKVVSLCWTGSGVLGYQGFRQWFTGTDQPPNLLVVFSPMDQPLPVAAAAFSLVHSHDCLHRDSGHEFFAEALRAAAPDSPIIHAHIHLADAEPLPFFERGGVIRPADEYRALIANSLGDDDARSGDVVSEAALYLAIRSHDLCWPEIAAATGYNGFALLARPELKLEARRYCARDELPANDARLLANPLLRINPLTGSVCVDPSALGGRALEMLERHPPSSERLDAKLPRTVAQMDMDLLAIAEAGSTISEAAIALALPVENVARQAARMVGQELAVVTRMPGCYHGLFAFHSNLRSIFDTDLARVLLEWAALSPAAAGGVLMGSEVSRQECMLVVSALVRYFRKLHVSEGDTVGFLTDTGDTLWPLVACLLLGAKPVFEQGEGHRLVVTRTNVPGLSQQLCMQDDPAAQATLADVLAEFFAPATSADEEFDAIARCALPQWWAYVRADAQGLLQRR